MLNRLKCKAGRAPQSHDVIFNKASSSRVSQHRIAIISSIVSISDVAKITNRASSNQQL